MKTTTAVAVVFACLLLAGVPGPGQGDSGVKEAQTLDRLLERYSDETCRNCHGAIYEEWKESFHARSVMHSLGGLRNFIVVGIRQEWRRDVTKGDLMKCFHCHAPMLYDASEELVMKVAGLVVSAADEKDPRRKEDAQKELSRLTVNCVICHNTVVHRPSQGWLGKTERDTMYGTKVVKAPHRTAQSTIIGSSLFCGQCHGTYNPPDSDTVFCNTLHESYLNAYIPAGGLKTCQQCHMTKERGHRFPGAYDAAMVRQGLEFEAEAVAYKHIQGSTWVPRIIATVNIFNRSGHRVPDG